MGRNSLIESDFNTTRMKNLSETWYGNDVPGTRNVAPYHVPGDIGPVEGVPSNTEVVGTVLGERMY